MHESKSFTGPGRRVAIALLVAGVVTTPALAQSVKKDRAAATASGAQANTKGSPYRRIGHSDHARIYSQSVWGVDNLKVTRTASDNLIRFSYRVIDPVRAKVISAKGSKPALVGLSSHAVLQVPVMDKVGELRQGGEVISGKEYWMVFSNKGNLVKPGERVNIVIGAFHADGLLLE
jgi:hypothetical protein